MTKTKQLDATTLMVRPLDMAKLNADINDAVHKERMFDPARYHVQGKWAICDARLSLVDDECIFWVVDNEDDAKIEFPVYWEKQEEKGLSFGMFPSFTTTQAISNLRDYQLEPIPLAKFMADRYEYNGRIQGNTHQYLKWVNGGKL